MIYKSFIVESRDGFVTKQSDSSAWLKEFEVTNIGYQNYYDEADVVIMGIGTYKKFWTNPVMKLKKNPKKKTIVLSHNRFFDNEVESYSEGVISLDYELSGWHKNAFIVGGPKVINSYIMADMLDEFVIAVVDRDLKKGVKLFEDDEVALSHFDLTREEEVKINEKGDKATLKYYTRKGRGHGGNEIQQYPGWNW